MTAVDDNGLNSIAETWQRRGISPVSPNIIFVILLNFRSKRLGVLKIASEVNFFVLLW